MRTRPIRERFGKAKITPVGFTREPIDLGTKLAEIGFSPEGVEYMGRGGYYSCGKNGPYFSYSGRVLIFENIWQQLGVPVNFEGQITFFLFA